MWDPLANPVDAEQQGLALCILKLGVNKMFEIKSNFTYHSNDFDQMVSTKDTGWPIASRMVCRERT